MAWTLPLCATCVTCFATSCRGAGLACVPPLCAGVATATGAFPRGGGLPFGAAAAVPQMAQHIISAIIVFFSVLFIVVFLSSFGASPFSRLHVVRNTRPNFLTMNYRLAIASATRPPRRQPSRPSSLKPSRPSRLSRPRALLALSSPSSRLFSPPTTKREPLTAPAHRRQLAPRRHLTQTRLSIR